MASLRYDAYMYLKNYFIRSLRWSEKYTKTDMVYLASSGFWLVLEQVTGVLFSLALAIAFGHFASQDMYGNYKYILSLAGLLSAVSLSGLSEAMAQSVTRGFDGALQQSLRSQIRWSLPFVATTLAISWYYWMQDNNFVAGSLVIVALVQPFLAGVSSFTAFFYAQKDFIRGSLYFIGVNAITFLSLLLALFLGERAIILVATYFIVRTLASGYSYLKAVQRMRNTNEDPGLLQYGGHLSAINILGAISDKLDNVLVFTLLGPSQLAIYAFSIAMPEQIKGLLKNFYGLSLPKLAERPLDELRVTLWPKIGTLFVLSFVIICVYIFTAPYLFYYLFPIYTDAIIYSQWCAVSVFFSCIPPVLTAALTAHKKTRALYIATNTPHIVSITGLLVLVPLFGIAGAIATQIASRATFAAVTAWQFMRS